MLVHWWDWWKTLPEEERQQWTLHPFVSVGPLRFGMNPGEVAQALGAVTSDTQVYPHHPYGRQGVDGLTEGSYQEFGLSLYYRGELLDCVAVSARLGPQVLADGVRLVGQVPSDLEKWLLDRAEARPDNGECTYMAPGIAGSDTLGAWIDVQRAGDHLLTRPILVSYETMDNLADRLPRHVWSDCDPS